MSTSFGRDISCTDTLRSGRFASGLRLVAEAAFRRLTTPRGMLLGAEEEANYGFDLTELVGSVRGPSDVAAIPGRVQAELLKDERIESVDVTALSETTGPAITLLLTVTATTNEGPFELQVQVSDVTIELLGIRVIT